MPSILPQIKSDKNEKAPSPKLGQQNYINRLMAFIASKKRIRELFKNSRFHLDFIGNRLDSIYKAANKGSHTTIVSREEADRCVIYTYLLIGDILSKK